MIKKFILGIALLALLSFTLVSNFREIVIKKLENYANNYPEKLYLQTDKPYYTIGDDIWYTAYLVNGITHERSKKSNIIYVELIDASHTIIDKKQLFSDDVSVAGDFKITADLKPGKYTLRAYTNYMRNKSGDYFFQKEISIWDVKKPINTASIDSLLQSTPEKKLEPKFKPTLNFYPEGGNLINGLHCKMVVKASDEKNRDVSIQGVIKNSDGVEVCPFKTQDLGMAFITLNPEPNKTYYASVFINDEEIKYPLPKALPNGYKLSAANHGNQIIINVVSNTALGLKNTLLVGHERGALIFEKLETEGVHEYSVQLSTKLLRDGVANFTLFDNNGRPVCERLVFIDNPENDIKVNVSLNKKSPKTRDKVTLKLNLKDKDSLPLSGNMSMSITDIDAVGQSTKSENIKTYLLLNSDLRGTIKNPGYFFEKNNDPKRRYLLDLVMLSHGWRRFTWTDLLYKSPSPDKYNAETGLYISGRTLYQDKSLTKISAATRITFMSKPPFQDKMQSNEHGIFKYGPFIFNDSMPVLIEARVKDFKSDANKKNRFVSIYLDAPFNNSPKITKHAVIKDFIEDSTKVINFINQSKNEIFIDSLYLDNATRLEEVLITATRETEEEKRHNELNDRTLHGEPSHRIDMSEYENYQSQSIFFLINMLPGVSAHNGSISIRNSGTPKIMLDGVIVELEDIEFMTGDNIEFIDVLTGIDAAMYSNAANGIIAIYSKEGSFNQNSNIERKPGIIDFTAKGFYTAREFYAPDYDDEFNEASKQDIRTTLHWEPKIRLSTQNPNAEISFFTSDIQTNYAIKIEGITDSGTPFYHLSTLEVD
ncbi:TonB-dependent receptor plug domain-containing protein [Tamlana sp. I1]|uniref:TonB-dependent receptor plug domain-containing protein n=1 Tax=Tamlana sp. I1 TaxID=2762061 RepID=UPI00188EE0AB|nr:Plug domain-containing protein [Tamlana sp. I1]